MAGFYLVSVLVGGFSSILAYYIMQMEGVQGLRSWRWIFIIVSSLSCDEGFSPYTYIYILINGFIGGSSYVWRRLTGLFRYHRFPRQAFGARK